MVFVAHPYFWMLLLMLLLLLLLQVPLGPPTSMQPEVMLVYNKTRSFQCQVDADRVTGGPDARRLAALVRERGISGSKGYFNAYIDQETQELVVVSNAMLPAQPW